MYQSRQEVCRTSPFPSQCTESKDLTKRISRHVWADYFEESDHLRHTEMNKKIYAKRKETIERVFVDMKEKHGMRWTTLRGLEKGVQAGDASFLVMNLKARDFYYLVFYRPISKTNSLVLNGT